MSITLAQKIESILFYTTEPMSIKKLSKVLGVSAKQVEVALDDLNEALSGRGIILIRNNDEAMLGTHPETHAIIEQQRKEELGGTLSKAALETLTIVAYRNGITKSEIDYIRGVNSNFILRNLMMRGLIERTDNPADKRSPLYQPTLDTLRYLGISTVTELHDYENFTQALEKLHSEFTEGEA